MRVFKTKGFSRFARKKRLNDAKLTAAVLEIELGLHDGDLGGHLLKKRIARAGTGKRGGYRTILVYQRGRRVVFLYGFAKNEKDTLIPVELQEYQKAARVYVRLSDADMGKALEEIDYAEQEIS
jgi:hypothetical protein